MKSNSSGAVATSNAATNSNQTNGGPSAYNTNNYNQAYMADSSQNGQRNTNNNNLKLYINELKKASNQNKGSKRGHSSNKNSS